MEESTDLKKCKEILKTASLKTLSIGERSQTAIELARHMLNEALKNISNKEKSHQKMLAKLMNDPNGKAFITSMTDQCFRSKNKRRIADQLIYLINKFGIPKFLPFIERAQLFLFKYLGNVFSSILVPIFLKTIRKQASSVIINGEPIYLSKFMKLRRQKGIKLNLNHLGEAILGENEAKKRIDDYLLDLKNQDVECISVKISTLFSQINLLDFEETLFSLKKRLSLLYKAALDNEYIQLNGQRFKKFVYLDMEEYKDLNLTVELFCNTLDAPEFHQLSAGIVLQAYLPDSFSLQEKITSWAIRRVESGRAPIKIRIVKGANMAMEHVDASLHGWEIASYNKKIETDANYKKMIIYGFDLKRIQAVHIGVASHNLFDIAFAMLLRAEKHIEEYVSFEMLEGMAEPIRQVVNELTGQMLLYCPVATENNFQTAIAYLTRRLDENTAPDNFLRYAFEMVPGTDIWQIQANLFSSSCQYIDFVSKSSKRQKNLFNKSTLTLPSSFENIPDTDWSLLQNIKDIHEKISRWSSMNIDPIPLVIGNQIVKDGVEFLKGKDPSFPDQVKYHFAIGKELELEIAIKTAEKAVNTWSNTPKESRLKLLRQVAIKLYESRIDLCLAMTLDTAKPIPQGDSEVSEAIDFITYYSKNIEDYSSFKDVEFTPKGIALIISPWNFPCSIPVGGIAAALAAGNSVIFKPAPEAVLVGWYVANAFWDAGIDRKVLQFFCCQDEPIGTKMIQDSRISTVILTGATATAKHFLNLSPNIHLFAETGGKNTMIITSLADKDLAIKDLIDSAFLYSGQKCSACSLAILEKEVYEDPSFLSQLKSAAASLSVDTPWNLSARVIPLIKEPSVDLMHALTKLDDGEEWLLKPSVHKDNPNLWSPGIKLGVKPNSRTYKTELFGPVLGLMCAANLKEAITLANGTPYGLTAGIHTLDDREKDLWTKEIIAGNCYINRTITGAIVHRQPFGGCKASSYGPMIKAGGPNYVLQLMHKTQIKLPLKIEPIDKRLLQLDQYVKQNLLNKIDLEIWSYSLGSYAYNWNHYFSKTHELTSILGQTNTLKYVLKNDYIFRFTDTDPLIDVLRIIAAALTCNATLTISCWTKRDDLFNNVWLKQAPSIQVIEETEEQFLERLHAFKIKQIRMIGKPSLKIKQAIAENFSYIANDPVMSNGRFELLHFLREVSISNNIHRYGYLPETYKTL